MTKTGYSTVHLTAFKLLYRL